jgi:hypothetical protein
MTSYLTPRTYRCSYCQAQCGRSLLCDRCTEAVEQLSPSALFTDSFRTALSEQAFAIRLLRRRLADLEDRKLPERAT